MTDKTFHVLDLILVAGPLWVGVIYFIMILRLYPPHRHTFDRHGRQVVEYPPRFRPGVVERINGGAEN